MALTAHAFSEERPPSWGRLQRLIRKPFKEAAVFASLARHLGVAYCYVETPRPPEAIDDRALRDAVGSLPADLLAALEKAALALNAQETLAVIDRSRPTFPRPPHPDRLRQCLSLRRRPAQHRTAAGRLGRRNVPGAAARGQSPSRGVRGRLNHSSDHTAGRNATGRRSSACQAARRLTGPPWPAPGFEGPRICPRASPTHRWARVETVGCGGRWRALPAAPALW